MMKTYLVVAILSAGLALPAQAEEVTISQAFAAGSLHEGPLDMVAYWTEVQDGALEVTATFRNPETSEEPMRVVMPMQDGDALAFGMPGYEGSLYRFGRAGQEVTISVDSEAQSFAQAN